MPEGKRKYKKNQDFNLYLFLITIVLLLTVVNIELFFYKQRVYSQPPIEVLGAETTSDELQHWMEITRQNPWYLPAWIEITRIAIDKNDHILKNTAIENIERIDPNNKLLRD
jgi:hypothetical protein